MTKQQLAEELKRCERCGWPYAADRSGGCVPGNCSQRPLLPLRMGRTEHGLFVDTKYAADCRELAKQRRAEGEKLIAYAEILETEAARPIVDI